MLALLLVTAGCAGGFGSDAPGETASSSAGDAGDSPAATDECTETTRETVTPVHEPTPRQMPGLPDELTREFVREFAVAYEEAYRYNGHLEAGTTDQTVSASDVTVTRVEDGYVVRLTSFAYGYLDSDPYRTETGSPRDVHWDGARYDVAYLVTEDRVLRRESTDVETTPDPREGVTVECR